MKGSGRGAHTVLEMQRNNCRIYLVYSCPMVRFYAHRKRQSFGCRRHRGTNYYGNFILKFKFSGKDTSEPFYKFSHTAVVYMQRCIFRENAKEIV